MTAPAKMSTEGFSTNENGSIAIVGRESINAYAFLMLRNAVVFRINHGGSMLRNQECRMAQNYGWSTRKRFGQALLDDLNKIGDENGIARSKLDKSSK